MPPREYKPEPILEAIWANPEWASPVDAQTMVPAPEWCTDPLLHEFVFSILLWESTMENAVRAMKKVHAQFVDYNELRVSFPSEIESILGVRYHKAEERSNRMVDALRAIFDNHQRLSLEPLHELSKREARDFLESIESLPRFVVSRVMLLGLDAHALPIDAKIARSLHKADLIPDHKNADKIAIALEKVIRANQSQETYTRLERWLAAFENGELC